MNGIIGSGKKVHLQRSAGITLCGESFEAFIAVSPSEVTCRRCERYYQLMTEVPKEKMCTVCKHTKPIDAFYYNSSTDTLLSKCMECHSRYVSLSKQYRKMGRKLTTKEFRENKLYEKELVV